MEFPYSYRLTVPMVIWSLICMTFMYVSLLGSGVLGGEDSSTLTAFFFSFILVSLLVAIAKTSGYGPFSVPEVKTLSSNVSGGRVSPELPPEQVAKTFTAFHGYYTKTLSFSLLLVIVFTISLCMWQSVIHANHYNSFMIALLGIVTGSLLFGFSVVWSQLRFFPVAKQCRDLLARKGRCPIEAKFQSIRMKFLLLVLFFLDAMVLYAISAMSFLSGNIIFLTGMSMVIFVIILLLFYIDKAFEEFFDLTKIAFTEDLNIFSTGSLDKEFVDLARNLNELSIQLYFFKDKVRFSEKEMKGRMEELEKFFEMTVEREQKMIELKMENKSLKDKIEGFKK